MVKDPYVSRRTLLALSSTIPALAASPVARGSNMRLAVRDTGLFTDVGAIAIPIGTHLIRTTGFDVEARGGAYYQRWKAGMTALDPAQENYSWRADRNGERFFLSPQQWVTPYMFGGANDVAFTTDQTTVVQKFWDWYNVNPNTPIDTSIAAGIQANAASASPIITIGPESEPSAKPARTIVGDHWLRVIAGSRPATIIVKIQNITRSTWHGGIRAEGPANEETFAERQNHAIGLHVENCGRLHFTGICRGDRVWYCGIAVAKPNNNMVHFSHIWATDCGSGHDRGKPGARSLTGKWSNPVNSGSASTGRQRTTLTLDAFPPHTNGTDAEDYMNPAHTLYQLRLEGDPRLYKVISWDATAGTVKIFPWIDSTLGSSGTYEWVFGGGWMCRGGDGQILVDGGTLTDCGNGFQICSQYAAKVHNQTITNCGTGGVVGRGGTASTLMGLEITGHYCEGNTRDLVFATPPSAVTYGRVLTEINLDPAKLWDCTQPRDRSNGVYDVYMTKDGGWNINIAGRDLTHQIVSPSGSAKYTLELSDRHCLKRMTSRRAVTITVPPRSSVKFIVNDYVDFFGAGAGTITFSPGEGVTINSRSGLRSIDGQFGRVRLQKMVEPDTWLLSGDLA